jgi:hypothetical protein
MPQTNVSITADQQERINRRALDGPAVVRRASQPGRCVTCQCRYPAGARIVWLTGSGPCHEQHAPPRSQVEAMRAALALAGRAEDAAELRGWLEAVGLIMAPPRRTAGRQPI